MWQVHGVNLNSDTCIRIQPHLLWYLWKKIQCNQPSLQKSPRAVCNLTSAWIQLLGEGSLENTSEQNIMKTTEHDTAQGCGVLSRLQ